MTTQIGTRTYKVEKLPSPGVRLQADLISRGFDGDCYVLRGVRGATKLAYRTQAGKFSIVN